MEIERYIGLIWRWTWLIILGAVVSGGVAFLISKNTTPVYRASARFLIDEAPGTATGNDFSQLMAEQRLAQTYVEIMRTNPVLTETAKRLDLPPTVASRLGNMISISAPQDTQIIIVSVEDTNPKRAAAIANTLGQVFIETNSERESLRYAEPINNWQTRITEISQEMSALETSINRLGTPESPEEEAEISQLETKLNEAQIRYTDAFNNLNELQVEQAKQSSNVVQIEQAIVNPDPIRPRILTNTVLATVVGAMVALGIVSLLEYLDDTIKTPDQIHADTGLSTVGAIAFIQGEKPSERLITQLKPRDPISEAYRVVRTNLDFVAVDGGLNSLLISSSSPGEGKSTTTANLAVVMAQTGKRVIVVDADLRRPTQHKLFTISNNQGLTTAILDSQTPVTHHLQNTKIKGLRVMTSGPIPPNPAELLNSQRMSQVLSDLEGEADVVVLDSPPILTVADAAIMAPRVSGALVVAEVGKTRRDTFVQGVERLHKTGASLFGAVINQLKPQRTGYYSDYYYYNYYGSYEQERKPRASAGNLRLPGWLSGLSKR